MTTTLTPSDIHMKNFAMFHTDSGLRLTPTYDQIAAYLKVAYASVKIKRYFCGYFLPNLRKSPVTFLEKYSIFRVIVKSRGSSVVERVIGKQKFACSFWKRMRYNYSNSGKPPESNLRLMAIPSQAL